MSTSEPFLPAGEAPRDADPRERDIDEDIETDTAEQPGVDDPDAAAASSEPNTTFQTPRPGDRLSPEALADELDDEA